jgi:hypothetical protein
MGNRGGCLHDDAGELGVARWRSRQWIICLLEFKGRHRTVMTPGRYTELFFLDEATALAAGHRPCMECQREAFKRFRAAWLRGNESRGHGSQISAPELDRELHGERVTRGRLKITAQAPLHELSDGAFVVLRDAPDESFLLFAQTGAYSVERLWLTGPRAGTREMFVENLPAFPDNLSLGSDGLFWVALPSTRSVILDFLSSKTPILR